MTYSALIVAAGNGSRMGLGYNKVYAPLRDGRPILFHTMDVFLDDPDCHEVVVVTDEGTFRKRWDHAMSGRIVLVRGGKSRQESVANGLTAVTENTVLIHDGARPYLSRQSLDDIKETMKSEEAACLVVPCKDTIKEVKDGYIMYTPARDDLAAAQTPQAFRTDLIFSCMNKAMRDGYTGTDDSSLVERYSEKKVKAVEGSYENIKITTPDDLK